MPRSSPGSEDLTWDWSEPDGEPSPSPRSTPTPAPSLLSDGPESPTSVTSPVLLTMREGKPGGGKGPLLAVDESLTLAQGNGQVLFATPIDFRQTSRGDLMTPGRTGGPPGTGVGEVGDPAFTVSQRGQAVALTGPTPPSGPAGSPARTSPSPASDGASAATDPPSPSSSLTLWSDTDPDGSSSRTSLVYSPLAAVPISPASSASWGTSGTAWRGESSMLATTTSLNAAEGYSCSAPARLADVLEPSAPPRYSLTPRAAQGILRRAARRGRALPPALESALSSLAQRADKEPISSHGRSSEAPPLQRPDPSEASMSSVRRLTERECEALMGWPRDHTVAWSWNPIRGSRPGATAAAGTASSRR